MQRDIVIGAKFTQKITGKIPKSINNEYLIGSYAPSKELYIVLKDKPHTIKIIIIYFDLIC